MRGGVRAEIVSAHRLGAVSSLFPQSRVSEQRGTGRAGAEKYCALGKSHSLSPLLPFYEYF